MKKFLGAIISGAVGVLTLIFLTMPAFEKESLLKTNKYSGWDLLTNKGVGKWEFTAVNWYRIFAWVLVVLAVILIVMAVIQLLSSLGIVKISKMFTKLTIWTLVAILVVSVLTLAANFGIRGEWIDVTRAKDAYGVGVSLWFVAITNLIGAVAGKVFVKD